MGGARDEGQSFWWRRGARPAQTGGMDWVHRLLAPLAEYPRWFVATCAALVLLAVLWLCLKLLKWALYLAVGVVLLVAAFLAVAWLAGG
jgi:uncharacterized RDD family membrane protein YckC